MAKIIALNSGSSSLKFQIFEMPQEKVICSGNAERIGLEKGIFTIKVGDDKFVENIPIANHKKAIELLLNALLKYHIINDIKEIKGAGHRIVQGGSYFDSSVKVDDEVIRKVEELSELAPLHNPAHLICYKAFKEALPAIGHVFVFDTSFHQTMKAESYLFPVPYEWYEKYKIRRYGAHGTSHQYIANRYSEITNQDLNNLNLITCHLGNGASISAIKNGKCINTSMGLSPLGGIMMGTRSGDLDPTVVLTMMKKMNYTADEMDDFLNKKSGMLGVSNISSDARDIEAAYFKNDERAIRTYNLYINRVINVIGGYYMQLGHVDAIIFTAGLGENSVFIRKGILNSLSEAMELNIDYELNDQVKGVEAKLSLPDSKIDIYVIPTNEELVIARDTVRLLNIC